MGCSKKKKRNIALGLDKATRWDVRTLWYCLTPNTFLPISAFSHALGSSCLYCLDLGSLKVESERWPDVMPATSFNAADHNGMF